MGIKDKYLEYENAKAQQAAIKFIEWVMEEEQTDFRTAQAMCETIPEYSLGLKLSMPAVQQMLNKGSLKRRSENAKRFAADLPDDERILFERSYGDRKEEYRNQMKIQKREAKKEKNAAKKV